MKRIVVFGNYGHQNVGDDLFVYAFKLIFPNYNFTFTDKLSVDLLKNHDALFFGGGSFLSEKIVGFKLIDFTTILDTIPIFYVGAGLETEIHEDHWHFLLKAKSIFSRTTEGFRFEGYKKQLNIEYLPDLVWALKNSDLDSNNTHKENSVLILPNVSVLPLFDSPSWVTSAWENFKNQLAQFIDYLILNDYTVDFYSMSKNSIEHDDFAAYQIISMMKNKNLNLIKNNIESLNESNLLQQIYKYDAVITQRYHGIVLSEIANTKVLPIYHHEKLKVPGAISYYEVSKHKLIDSFFPLQQSNISVNFSVFEELRNKIEDILNVNEKICGSEEQ